MTPVCVLCGAESRELDGAPGRPGITLFCWVCNQGVLAEYAAELRRRAWRRDLERE